MKYMLALNTDFHGTSRRSEEIREALSKIAGAGFSHVHWCHEWAGSYLYSVHEMLQIREWCDEFSLCVKGLHASGGEKHSDLKDYTSPNDYSRLAGVELLRNRVDLAHILNGEAIVLHLVPSWQRIEQEEGYLDDFLRPVLRSFDELESYCKTRKVKICIENHSGRPDLNCRLFDALYERYDKDYMGLCFDTGHANLHCKENRVEYAERYNDRLFMIHIHDNQGEKDEHILPFKGSFDWEGFARVLASSPYRFPIVMEPEFEEEADDTAWLDKAFEIGSRFTEMVQKYRP